LAVSVIGLGTNNFGGRISRERTEEVLDQAIDCGITCIDTADAYGDKGLSEEYIGEILKGRRQNVIIATKFASAMGDGPMMRGGSRRYIYHAVHESLRRLQTDYIDLYQMHFPDSGTPIEETLRALDDLVREGLIRYIGCSNFSAWQIADAHWTADTEHLTSFISAQNRYSLVDRSVEAEILPACGKYGLGMLPFYPLAGGFLTGKYRMGEAAPEGTRLAAGGRQAERTLTEGNFATLHKLEQFAGDRGHTVLELAIAWLAAQPTVSSVIAGATSREQVLANVQAAEWKLSSMEVAEVGKLASHLGD
jgi:aryl-alcohol dehydrogenase-like predicted oxidoreductase